MHVLITGATGFVGGALVRSLLARGDRVSVLSRHGEAARKRLGVHAAWSWNAQAEAPPAEAYEEVDAIVHLAGESVAGLWTGAKKKAIRESRVTGTRNLVAGLARAPGRPRVLVSTSAIGYYGDRGEDRLAETDAPGTDFLAGVCRSWEAEARAASAHGVRVVTPRFGIVLGRTGGALQAMLRPFRLGLGGRLGSGQQWWSWIHLDDVVGLIELALQPGGLDDPVDGPINATSPTPVRQAAFARALGATVGMPAVVPAPAIALRLVLGEFASELLTSKRVVPKRALELGYEFRFPTIEGALADLVTPSS